MAGTGIAFSEDPTQTGMIPRTGDFGYFVCALVLSVLISLLSIWLSLFSFSHEHNDGAFKPRYFRHCLTQFALEQLRHGSLSVYDKD